MSTQKKSKP